MPDTRSKWGGYTGGREPEKTRVGPLRRPNYSEAQGTWQVSYVSEAIKSGGYDNQYEREAKKRAAVIVADLRRKILEKQHEAKNYVHSKIVDQHTICDAHIISNDDRRRSIDDKLQRPAGARL